MEGFKCFWSHMLPLAQKGLWKEEEGVCVCEATRGGGWRGRAQGEGVKGDTEEKCACERVCMKDGRFTINQRY